MSKFATDAIRPSALPSASLGRRGLPTAEAGASANTEKEALEKEYQAWNTRIDTEVKSLSSGLKELVQLANVRDDFLLFDAASPYHVEFQTLVHIPVDSWRTSPGGPGATGERSQVLTRRSNPTRPLTRPPKPLWTSKSAHRRSSAPLRI